MCFYFFEKAIYGWLYKRVSIAEQLTFFKFFFKFFG